jgi:hypothetical protein
MSGAFYFVFLPKRPLRRNFSRYDFVFELSEDVWVTVEARKARRDTVV